MSAWTERVQTELREVVDPCSCLTPNPISIVDLGLVQDVEVKGDDVVITLCMTDPMCMYFVDIASEIETRVKEIGWDGAVTVNWDTSADWRPEMMSQEARRARFEARLRLNGLKPPVRTT